MINTIGIWLASVSLAFSSPVAAAVTVVPSPAASTRQAILDGLLAADRAFSEAASQTDTVSGLSAMFTDNVVMPLPGATFARGREEAVAAMRSNPFNLASRAQWTPVRGGISADGEHGFTIGYMVLSGTDGSQRLAKYLAYWIRQADRWRVAVYKRAPRPEGEISLEMLDPVLPPQLVTANRTEEPRHRESLDLAERGFSNEAQRVGLREAFQRNGSRDAMLMGRGPGFAVGLQAIREQSQPLPPEGNLSPVNWAPDGLLVASSGDLGVTWGRSHANLPVPEGQPATQVFMTVWGRPTPDTKWLYLAE